MQILNKGQSGQLEIKINREEFEAFGKGLITTLVLFFFAVGIVFYHIANNFLNLHLNLPTLAIVFLMLLGIWIMITPLFL